MKRVSVYLGLLAFLGGLGAAKATFAPGDPIEGPAYMNENGVCTYVTECEGSEEPCTIIINGQPTQLFWDVEDQNGDPSGVCTIAARFDPVR